ncbi:MAG: hypothetical protein IPF47_08525 [Gemmatimonadetes bacterium]|nr:hypothetical protein [Gemmatimonadota bacterium]
MNDTPIPPIPWQITGNHWIALPCIHPGDGSIHAVGTLHRGARAAVELAGGEDFASGREAPIARPVLAIDGVPVDWSDTTLAWERALNWLPTFTATIGNIVVRATVFAPYGRDADTAGAVYAFAFENRSTQGIRVTVGLEGELGHRQLRVKSARAFVDRHAVRRGATDAVILAGDAVPGLMALAIGADGAATIDVPNERSYAIRREIRVPPPGWLRRPSSSRSAPRGMAPRRRSPSCAAAGGATCSRPRATRCAPSSRRPDTRGSMPSSIAISSLPTSTAWGGRSTTLTSTSCARASPGIRAA